MENQEQNTPGLEKLFARLEEVTADMEKSDITLEESFALYNEGMQLLKQCNETIDAVEKKFRFWTRMEKFMSFKEIQKEKTAQIEQILKAYLPRVQGIRK